MSCGYSDGLMLVRPWPYEGKPPWPWQLVDFGYHGHLEDKVERSVGISSWIVFLIILFMVFWSGFK